MLSAVRVCDLSDMHELAYSPAKPDIPLFIVAARLPLLPALLSLILRLTLGGPSGLTSGEELAMNCLTA